MEKDAYEYNLKLKDTYHESKNYLDNKESESVEEEGHPVVEQHALEFRLTMRESKVGSPINPDEEGVE